MSFSNTGRLFHVGVDVNLSPLLKVLHLRFWDNFLNMWITLTFPCLLLSTCSCAFSFLMLKYDNLSGLFYIVMIMVSNLEFVHIDVDNGFYHIHRHDIDHTDGVCVVAWWGYSMLVWFRSLMIGSIVSFKIRLRILIPLSICFSSLWGS